MPRYRLKLEYDGGPYAGFQAQAGAATVQGEVERAITAFCGESVRVAAAGRTDAGVHARGQVIHVDLAKAWPSGVVRSALNAHLRAAPIAVLEAAEVGADFHARFSARARRYLYRILDRPGPPALERGRVWHVASPLDLDAMALAARPLVGRHDFTTFRDAACQAASPDKTLDAAEVTSVGEEAHLEFTARSFLHRQVRSMVGSLVQVGLGRWPPERIAEVLAARDRSRCGPVAPPQGLCLMSVAYEGEPNAAK
jgi:tRNA pseudouridine38-40 synthase